MQLVGNMTHRQNFFDVLKAVMMFWIVWGHLGTYGVVEEASSIYVCNAKIGVNIPVFFTISGFFAARSFRRHDVCETVARTLCLVWPQFVFAFLCAIVTFAVSLDVVVVRRTFRFVLGFWFLHTLALIYIYSFIIWKIAQSEIQRWVYFVVAYGLMLFTPSCMRFWWNGQVIHMFPYFIFGLLVLSRYEMFRSTKVSLACAVFFLAVVFFQGDSSINGMNFWNVNPYWEAVFFRWRDFVTFFMRTAVGITGSVFLLFLAYFTVEKFPVLNRMSTLGTTTLGVYVIHEYPISLFSGICLPYYSRFFVALVWFLTCHYAITLVKNYKGLNSAFFLDEKFIASKIKHFLRRDCNG